MHALRICAIGRRLTAKPRRVSLRSTSTLLKQSRPVYLERQPLPQKATNLQESAVTVLTEYKERYEEPPIPEHLMVEIAEDDKPTPPPVLSKEDLEPIMNINLKSGIVDSFFETLNIDEVDLSENAFSPYGIAAGTMALSELCRLDLLRMWSRLGNYVVESDWPLWGPLNVYAGMRYLAARGIKDAEAAAQLGYRIRIGYLNFGDRLSVRHMWFEHYGAPLDHLVGELAVAAEQFGAPEYGYRPRGPTVTGRDLATSAKMNDAETEAADIRYLGLRTDCPSYLASWSTPRIRDRMIAVIGYPMWRSMMPHLDPHLHAAPIFTSVLDAIQTHHDAVASVLANDARERRDVANRQRLAHLAAEVAARKRQQPPSKGVFDRKNTGANAAERDQLRNRT